MARWLVVVTLLSVTLGCGVSSDVSRQLGARCDSHEECDQLCLGPGEQFPGGMCSRACDQSQACPAGSACVDLLSGVCLYTCDTAADCQFLGSFPSSQLDGGVNDAGVGVDAATRFVWQCLDEPGHPDGQVRVCIGK